MKDIRPIEFDGIEPGKPLIIAGPCSAETRFQTMETARGLAQSGIKLFRAGVWKPRTKPGCFEGIGSEALGWLRKVKEETGMYVSTEVANRQHVIEAIDNGLDFLWIGARTSANPFAVQEIADTLAELDIDIPILVKNPVNPDLELWIGALQRIYNAGIRRIGAIHRGFSAYGKHIYRNMPFWNMPLELSVRYPTLPIICDPSHIGGLRELIGPLSQQAMDMGFNGLIIESHCNPDEAWSDAAQQITPEILQHILHTIVIRETKEATENLTLLRQQIDNIDNELLDLLAKRMEISRKIGTYKKQHKMSVLQSTRFNNIVASRVASGERLGMSPSFMRTILLAIHEESVRQQVEILNDRNPMTS